MSKTENLFAPSLAPVQAASAPAHWRICGFVLLLVVIASVLGALRKDVTQGFDELAHASYVASLQQSGQMWPALDTMRMLDPASFRFTGQANYINHPPPYYWLFAYLGPGLGGQPGAIVVDRLMNVAIAALGLAALMAIALLARLSRPALYAYLIPLACVPVLAPLAGSINNDNAAFAGGALATVAAWQLIATGRPGWLPTALLGVVIASWAKLTGLMLAGGMLGGVLAWLLWRGRLQRAWIVPIGVSALVAVAPYVVFQWQYGSPAPNTPGQIDMLVSGAQAAGWDSATRMSPGAYAIFFAVQFITQWMPSLTPRSALNYGALAIPVMAVLCAGAGLMLSLRRMARGQEGPLDVIVAAGAAAAMATFAIHGVFAYERHVTYGWMMDAYPRYYLPLAAIVPLGGLSLLAAIEQPRVRTVLAAFLIAGPIVFRLLGAPLG